MLTLVYLAKPPDLMKGSRADILTDSECFTQYSGSQNLISGTAVGPLSHSVAGAVMAASPRWSQIIITFASNVFVSYVNEGIFLVPVKMEFR